MVMRLSGNAAFRILTIVVILATLHACTLPAVKPQVARGFREGTIKVATLAILPVDFGVTRKTKEGLHKESLKQETKLEKRMIQGLVDAFQKRGYQVKSLMNKSGLVDGVQIMKPDYLAELRVMIHQTSHEGDIEQGVFLPQIASSWTQKLYEQTGTEATVYARGWAYVDPDSGGSVGAVLVVLMVVLFVFVLVAALAGSSESEKSSSESRKKSSRKSSSKSCHRIRHRRGPTQAGSHHQPRRVKQSCGTQCSGRASGHHRKHLSQGMGRMARVLTDAASQVDVQVVVHPQEVHQVTESPEQEPVNPAAETWQEVIESEIKACPIPPPSGSSLGLSISMIHNATGQVLWHGNQRFDILANDSQKLQNLMEHFLKEMPVAGAMPAVSESSTPSR